MRQRLLLVAILLLCLGQTAFAGEAQPVLTDTTVVATPQQNLLYPTETVAAADDTFFDDDTEFFTESEYELPDTLEEAYDPFEGWNRFWFDVNDFVYVEIAQPANTAYRFVVPSPVRTGIGNLIVNWFGMPRRFANAILQGKFALAGIEFSRFVCNTAFGFGGLLDVAKDLKPTIEYTGENEDFGQTLATWGVPAGPYLVLPFFGASNFRDTAGIVGEGFLPPSLNPVYLNYGVFAAAQFNQLDTRLAAYEQITGSSVEPYIGMRNAYFQLRKAQIEN